MATFLTLVFLPSILLIFNKWKVVKTWLMTGKVEKATENVERAVIELEYERLVDEVE